MKGDLVPDGDNISRLCGGSHIENGTIKAGAFLLGPNHTYLSVNWLECLGFSDRPSQIAEIQRVMATKRRVGALARLAVASVGAVRNRVRSESEDHRELRILHEPEDDPLRPDPSHCGVHDLKQDDLAMAILLARAFSEVHPARAW
jgi:hypothetical protein